jgi:hypothetical protein
MITITFFTTIMTLFINYYSADLFPVYKSSSQVMVKPGGSANFSEEESSKYLYLGAEKCASVCHNNDTMGYQYNSWLGSPHREAYSVLASKKAEKYARAAKLKETPMESQACLKCHITGANLDSSYLTATYKKDDGVTCEACHKHRDDGKTYIPKEEDCLLCHNESIHKISKFSYTEGYARIAHPRAKKSPSADILKASSD